MTNPIKLIIADDEMLIRTGLKIMLEASGTSKSRFSREWTCGLRSLQEAPTRCGLDIRMPKSTEAH